jgi:hypothetical protein
MGGGLMQLVAYGAQDIYLTGNPQITFFKVVYRRHTNFSMETISQSLDGNATIGTSNNEASCTIARNGDLIHKMYITSSSTGIISGSKIINSAELEIGGQRIDKHTEEWNNVWNELSTPDSKSTGLKAMQCEDNSESGSSIGLGMVQVPLNFYFCRNPGLALPLIALQYHEVKINFVFGTSTGVCVSAAGAAINFFVDYIYLDTDERRRFAQVSHEYLIEQVQIQTITTDTTQELTFNHPVKELVWTTDFDYNTAMLKFNGHDRFEKQEEEYFQLRQPFDHHTTVPRVNLTVNNQIPRTHIEDTNLLEAPVVLGGANQSTTLGTGAFNIYNGNEANGTGVIQGSGIEGPVYCFNNLVSGSDMNENDILLFIGSGTNFGPFKDTTIHSVETELLFAPIQNPSLSGVTFTGNATGNTKCFQLGTEIFHTTTENQLTTAAQGSGLMLTLTAIHNVIRGNSSHEAYTSKLKKNISVYSFALKPEEHQPSGTCNFSRIDTATLEFGATPTGTNYIYAVNYNVLRIMSGMGGLAYSN